MVLMTTAATRQALSSLCNALECISLSFKPGFSQTQNQGVWSLIAVSEDATYFSGNELIKLVCSITPLAQPSDRELPSRTRSWISILNSPGTTF